jgi:hypothetical protein
MSGASHQTLRLSAGKHYSPDEGACVMELASMLAGERFGDHPRAVCPVIAVVLRGYNDGTGDEGRQDLYRFAAEAVGTRRRSALRERVEMSSEFFGVRQPLLARFAPRSWRLSVGRAAVRYAKNADERAHREFLSFVDTLVSVPERSPDQAGSADSRGSTHTCFTAMVNAERSGTATISPRTPNSSPVATTPRATTAG